jgi:hypothetical protein
MKKKYNLELAKPFFDLAYENRASSKITLDPCPEGDKLMISIFGEKEALKAILLFGDLCRKVKPGKYPLITQKTADKRTGVYLEVTPAKFLFSSFSHGNETISIFDELEII